MAYNAEKKILHRYMSGKIFLTQKLWKPYKHESKSRNLEQGKI